MPPLQARAKGTNEDLETGAKDAPETDAKDAPEMGASDAPETGVNDVQGKIVMTGKREIPENKLKAIPMNARNKTKIQEVKGAIRRETTENRPHKRNIDMAGKIGITRKGPETETEINVGSEGTKPTMEKIVGLTTEIRRRFPKRKVSVVFSPSFSGNRLAVGMQKQRVHARSGSL